MILPNLWRVPVRKAGNLKNPIMNRLVPGLTLAGLLICWLSACNKETSNSSSKPDATAQPLALSDQSVKRGQPLVAALPKGVSATYVKWSVNPDSTAHVAIDSGRAVFLFARGGTYHIFASYATGSDSSRRDSCSGTIVVSDSVYTPPPPPPPGPTYDTIAVDHDTLTLIPLADTNSLILVAQSSRRYGCTPYYLYSTSANVNSGLSLQFLNVVMGSGCGSPSPAITYIYLGSSISNWSNGTYPFSVNYSGTTYSGSLAITGTDYTFTWNYTGGVLISPLHVSR